MSDEERATLRDLLRRLLDGVSSTPNKVYRPGQPPAHVHTAQHDAALIREVRAALKGEDDE